ncbi:hemicentin-1 [Ctenocephalides felis]|uniref:hemicentin-1 n=1 Tax=Ctenocephalides felis TaxID=7515 RepID=UPI000E6E4280|nr:hemicentin-1 [Ctenocephalides felis]
MWSGLQALQRFEKQPSYTEVNPGQDALLTCKVLNRRGSCSWQKDNKPVGIYPKKYEWAAGDNAGARSASGGGGGDCSLWVRAATLEFDDGQWECQVTASDFTTQDALTSSPVRLVVRVAPQRPRIEYNTTHVLPGHNISVKTGERATVKCVSHYGNPPSRLKWFLGQRELMPVSPQSNNTEPDNPRTWSATSVVEVNADRALHGQILRCVALHESYPAKSQDIEARLDVRYAPTIRLVGAPTGDLEEGRDALVMRCVADANPPASVVWRRAGRSDIASLEESLQLRPVGRRDAGMYTCQAQNAVGASESLSVQLDVKYPPRILSVGPDRLTTAPLFSPAAFECVAEGNPPPSYQWLQRMQHISKFVRRGRDARLVIDNVTYDHQGEYVCKVSNVIGGSQRAVQSEPIAVQVVGAPQVLRHGPPPAHEVWARRGQSASLSLVVCADPRPRHVAWEWGSLRLEAGAGIGRYHVDEMVQDSREDCYKSTLHVNGVDSADSRPYYLVVENERGADRHAVTLRVDGEFTEPLAMSVLLGVAGGCLAGLILLVCLCVWAMRSEKCCFRKRRDMKAGELDRLRDILKLLTSRKCLLLLSTGRYHVDEMVQDSREDCYKSTLHVNGVDSADSRPYYLVVENERGADRHAVTLRVDGEFTEPLAMSVLLGVAGGCLAGLILLVCLCVWAMRSEKCCFRKRRDMKAGELDSEKPAISDKTRLDTSGLPISADAIYTTPAGYAGATRASGNHHLNHHNTYHGGSGRHNAPHSPEAMKTPVLRTFGNHIA